MFYTLYTCIRIYKSSHKGVRTLMCFCVDLSCTSILGKLHQLYLSISGHPMTISLINGQLEDHKEQMLAKNTSRWDYYVKLFSDKKLK